MKRISIRGDERKLWRVSFRIYLISLLLQFTSSNALAEALSVAEQPKLPPASEPTSDAVWDFYCASMSKSDSSDHLKCIKLGGRSQLSISGELRNRGEYFDHTALGSDSPSSGYLLQRYILSTDFRFGDHVRIFSTLESGLENGRIGGPRPSTDENRLFVHEGFLQFRSHREDPAFDLRIGRQDLSFGAGRLVGSRELPNVQANFDGVRLIGALGSWHANVFAVRPSISAPGIFDDSPDHTYSLWGVYATRKQNQQNFDLYYLGIDRKSAAFQAGTGREQRHTLGMRFADAHRGWDYDSEFAYQFGSFATRPISAWTATTYTGYTFARQTRGTQYRLAVDTGIASGNHGSTAQGSLGTFNALFPRGAYFGYANFIGPYNVTVVRPSLRITSPTKHLTIWPNIEMLWRQSKYDGVYSIPAVLVRTGTPQDDLYIGLQTDLNITWEQNRHLTWNLDGEHFFAGRFLHQASAGKSVNYIAPGVSYRF